MIKKNFNPGNYSQKVNLVFLLLRIGAGVLMLTHGLGKSSMLFGAGPIQFADPIGAGATASLALTVFAEVFCSALLIFGMATRLAVVPLLTTMLVAVFIVHANDAFGKKEMGLLYILVYLTLAITGAGKFSIDNLIYKKINR